MMPGHFQVARGEHFPDRIPYDTEPMSTILLVDDDPVARRIYEKGLAKCGFEIALAEDGLAAIRTLRTLKIDLVVLDLMMPKLGGADVMKFASTQGELATVPIVVLSNSIMEAASAVPGVRRALLKTACSPSVLAGIVRQILAGEIQDATVQETKTGAIEGLPKPSTPLPQEPPLQDHLPRLLVPNWPRTILGKSAAPKPDAEGSDGFLDTAAAACAAFSALSHDCVQAAGPAQREVRLRNFHHRVHFFAAAARRANSQDVSMLAGALEALLFELTVKPSCAGGSVLSTIGLAVKVLSRLVASQARPQAGPRPPPQVLILDNDPVLSRLAMAALHRVQVEATWTQDQVDAMHLLAEEHYDVILLAPGLGPLSGSDVVRLLRAMPRYGRTPLLYLVRKGEDEADDPNLLRQGAELILKPIFPEELALKAAALAHQHRLDQAESLYGSDARA
jgi:DNA-binding response OmpR family regulator